MVDDIDTNHSVSQDRSILGVATPKITAGFHSLDDIGWYGSAYLLTSCCSQLIFGKIYTRYSIKWVFIAALGIFEVGSILCAATPNSEGLIVGRAIAGLGATGISTGSLLASFNPLFYSHVFHSNRALQDHI